MSSRIRIVLGLVGVVVVAVVGLLVGENSSSHPAASHPATTTTVSRTAAPGAAVAGTATPEPGHVAGVPDRAYRTLVEIDAGRWPGSAGAPGTHGGDTWNNRGGQLPKTTGANAAISYREWDVNPKQPGHTRDAERIVTGSDGSAYYTGDHYKTFTRMR